jgi:hypothetical protein
MINVASALNGLTEKVLAYKFSQKNESGIPKNTFLPIAIEGNLQQGDNDDLLMVPEEERHYALWRLLVPERTQSLKNGDLVKIFYQGKDCYFKCIGCKDNTRQGFSRYILQERVPDKDFPNETEGSI